MFRGIGSTTMKMLYYTVCTWIPNLQRMTAPVRYQRMGQMAYFETAWSSREENILCSVTED